MTQEDAFELWKKARGGRVTPQEEGAYRSGYNAADRERSVVVSSGRRSGKSFLQISTVVENLIERVEALENDGIQGKIEALDQSFEALDNFKSNLVNRLREVVL